MHLKGGYSCLTHLPLVTHTCVSELGHHWFRWWLVACLVPSHYLNQCWFIVNWTSGNKFQWNFNRNIIIVNQENAFGNVVCHNGGHFVQGEMSYLLWPNDPMWCHCYLSVLHQGLYSLNGRRLTGIRIPIINLRESDGHLRFIMGIDIPIRWCLSEQRPRTARMMTSSNGNIFHVTDRFLVVGTIGHEERPPQGQLWMKQCLTFWRAYG